MKMKIKMRIKMRMKMKRKMRMKMSIKIRMKIKQINGYFKMIEKLTCDMIERCKLPEAIELRKKLGYNHDYIMIREETSIAEENNKTFP